MNVLRYALLPIACGFAMTATAAPVASLDQLSGRLLDTAMQTADAPSTLVSGDAQLVASTIASLATPSGAASKTMSFSKGSSTSQAVPEPESIALLAIAGAALVASRTRRARKA